MGGRCDANSLLNVDDVSVSEVVGPEPLLIQLDGDGAQAVRQPKEHLEQQEHSSGSVAPNEATVMLCSPAGFSCDSASGDRFGIESASRQKYELDRL
ncbi:GM26902 [Drosophila sechellia]|uniref:GM26902 n=1 Tax=Drosophila sechellia TaxID=7238 RepID=B4IEB5_DROSE|nr:GM26902 [Drosophila sechellia]